MWLDLLVGSVSPLPTQNQKSNHSGMRLEDLGLEAGVAHGVADMCSLNSLVLLRISAFLFFSFLFLSFLLSVSFWVTVGIPVYSVTLISLRAKTSMSDLELHNPSLRL